MNTRRSGNNFAWIALLGLSLLFVLFSVNCRKKDATANTPTPTPGEVASIGADGKIDLKILCTASPKEGRTDDFVEFLSKHFVKVATTDYQSFREEQADGFDVVIIDYGMTRPGSPCPQIAPGYARATVTMGVTGSEVCRRLNLKPGYL